MKLQHFKELDGVRALAALMVMFFHFFQQGLKTQNPFLISLQKYITFGQTGVSLFFVLSGFLITRILLNTKQSESYFRNFYIRRSLRIFPLYYFYLINYYFLVPLFQNLPIVPLNQEIWYWLYLQNIAMTFNWNNAGPGHFWSLAVEEHFYFFWPLVIYYCNKRKIKLSILVVLLVAFFTRIIMVKNHIGVFYFTLTRMDELGVGALLAILETERKLTKENLYKFVLFFVVISLPTISFFIFFGGKGLDIIQSTKFVLLSFTYFSLIGIIIVIDNNHWLKKLFRIKPISYTGKISYGLYVYHPLCFYLVKTHLRINSVGESFILSFSFVYAIASISYYAYESRFLLLKKRFNYS